MKRNSIGIWNTVIPEAWILLLPMMFSLNSQWILPIYSLSTYWTIEAGRTKSEWWPVAILSPSSQGKKKKKPSLKENIGLHECEEDSEGTDLTSVDNMVLSVKMWRHSQAAWLSNLVAWHISKETLTNCTCICSISTVSFWLLIYCIHKGTSLPLWHFL